MNEFSEQAYYRRTVFRSLLEARWAAYFDSIACPWKYEPGQAKFSGTVWTPDFVIGRDYQLVVECKGPHLLRIEKVAKFVNATGRSVLIALSEGRFVYCQAPTLKEDYNLLQSLLRNEGSHLDCSSKYRASLHLDENFRFVSFTNEGDACAVYTGTAPDYCDSFQDDMDPWHRDVRSWYYGGYSTWKQRRFDPDAIEIRRKPDWLRPGYKPRADTVLRAIEEATEVP